MDRKVCMELPFNRQISFSQRHKTKEFWTFIENESTLKPYEASLDKPVPNTNDSHQTLPVSLTKIWYKQFKVFQKFGLDKAASSAYKKCKMCSTPSNYGLPYTFTSTEQPYEELMKDMQAFDEKLIEETENTDETDITDKTDSTDKMDSTDKTNSTDKTDSTDKYVL